MLSLGGQTIQILKIWNFFICSPAQPDNLSRKEDVIKWQLRQLNQKTLFLKVIFPEALPNIFTGMRIALSLSLVIIVVTEMFIGIFPKLLIFRITT